MLLNFKGKGISVDSFYVKNETSNLKLSDGRLLSYSQERVSFVPFDNKELWCINGTEGGQTIGDYTYSQELNDKDLISIVEGYSDWFFVFKDGKVVSLVKSSFNYDPDVLVRGINHRGYNRIAPENTLAAFRLSRIMGFKYVETDIQFTLDGVPVLLHDYTVDRTSNGEGRISDLTWEQVRKLDFGGWKSPLYAGVCIPSLEEFLQVCRQFDLYPYIEIKNGTREQINGIVSLVDKYGLSDRVVYISFSATSLKYVLDSKSSASVGFLVSKPLTDFGIETALSLRRGDRKIFIDSSDYSESAITLCRNASLPLEIWTINSEKLIQSFSSYISGVTSDYLHAGRLLKE